MIRKNIGSAGERGLMQVSEKAANEWARENKIENFHVEDLFDPKTNLEAGAWYLQRAVKHWEHQPDPIPFRAGRIQCRRQSGPALGWRSEATGVATRDFLRNIDFPGTRKYVESIIERYQFYKRRGRM